jgi:hypothetical protein
MGRVPVRELSKGHIGEVPLFLDGVFDLHNGCFISIMKIGI